MVVKKKAKNKKQPLFFLTILSSAVVLILVLTFFSARNSRKKLPPHFEQEVSVETQELDSLPDTFPEDFPIYPDARLEESIVSQGKGGKAQSVMWIVHGTLEDTYLYYQENLAQNAWESQLIIKDENSVILTLQKNAVEGFLALGKGEDERVVVSVTFGAKFEEPSL